MMTDIEALKYPGKISLAIKMDGSNEYTKLYSYEDAFKVLVKRLEQVNFDFCGGGGECVNEPFYCVQRIIDQLKELQYYRKEYIKLKKQLRDLKLEGVNVNGY